MPSVNMDIPLPMLRPELQFHEGPMSSTGMPTFTLYDPLNRTFDKLTWFAAQVLVRLRRPNTFSRLMDDLNRSTTLRPSPSEVLEICESAVRGGLTNRTALRPVEQLLEERERMKKGRILLLPQRLLFFRVPLLHPERFLQSTVGVYRIFSSRLALAVYALLSVLGVALVLQRFDEYLATFPYFFNPRGVLAFALALVAVKSLHEFSHAFAAVHYGARVPVMGVAFMVLWPVAFCDVTDAWKLKDRGQRLVISGAGMVTEIVTAGLGLLCWALSPPGLARSVFFLLSSSSLISSLVINSNPAMRYDGYYLLSDLWGIDNLQPRAFAVARWAYRRLLLGMKVSNPEPEARPRRLAALTVYAVYCWIYRFFLYLGIAALVYMSVAKAIGIALFVVELGVLIGTPLKREAKSLYQERHKLGLNTRLLVTLLLLLGLAIWLALPLPRRYSIPAVLVPASMQVLYAPHAGRITSLHAVRGESVIQGQPLATVESTSLEDQIRVMELEVEIQEKELELLMLDQEQRGALPQKRQEIDAAKAALAGLRTQRASMAILAAQSGALFDWDTTLREGRHVRENSVLGKIEGRHSPLVYAFVDEERVTHIEPGAGVTFMLEAAPSLIRGTVQSVSPVRAETIDHLALTSQAAGALPVLQEEKGRLRMLESRYSVIIALDFSPAHYTLGQSGECLAALPPLLAPWPLAWPRPHPAHARKRVLEDNEN